ncbi:hypothetical protein DFJ74DRAFT_706123 [Hyaloraphidium curvatum]|nr:hypothetical protein DFJ74DRAFT_706123 [Hyaloraphidium curvatum]
MGPRRAWPTAVLGSLVAAYFLVPPIVYRATHPPPPPDDFSPIPEPLVDSSQTRGGIPLAYLEHGKAAAPPLDFVIDVGLNDGSSIVDFGKRLPWYQNAVKIGFECNPRLVTDLKDHAAEHDYVLYNLCAWTANTTMELYLDEHFEDSAGTSLFAQHHRAQRGRTRMVRTLDFPSYLAALVRSTDRVFLKIDVEGAEFRIVRRMALLPAPAGSLPPGAPAVPVLCLVDMFALEEHYEPKLRPPSLRDRERKPEGRGESRLKDLIEYLGDADMDEEGGIGCKIEYLDWN